MNFCALNVALYGPRRKRWAMTERGRAKVCRSRDALAIGKSWLYWDGDTLTIEIDEMTAPVPSRIRGQIRLHPAALTGYSTALDAEGRHRWGPIAPGARVEVDLDQPSLRWSGTGYLDSNAGDVPLERSFRHWTWSRAETRAGTSVLYDVSRRDGTSLSLALQVDRSGQVTNTEAPPIADLARSGWRIGRTTRADAGSAARVTKSLEDGPFYARSLVASTIRGEPVTSVHESLSLDRFAARWVQTLLPFRMPRAWR